MPGDRNGFVPDDFDVPRGLRNREFRLEPLGPRHNAADHDAWTSSIRHIRATPGFPYGSWPPVEGMTLQQNLADLRRHAADFAGRTGFTYTVLAPESDKGDTDNTDNTVDTVIGCVYIYPAPRTEPGSRQAAVRSWVRASHAHLDRPLRAAVTDWLAERWPIEGVRYDGPGRPA